MPDPFLDATAQAELVRRGEVSPRELVDEAVHRIEELNPSLNAVVIPLFDKAYNEADKVGEGPFAGVPYLLKDITMVTEGDLHAASIAGVKAAGYRSDHDSFFVQRMREAGFVLVGKTNTPELGIQPTTEPDAWGPSANPWDLSRSSGASSGGSAAAVAAGMVSIAHGNDGGGSIRMPASQCGVIGIKPTRGRISQGPTVRSDNVSGMPHEGLLAHSVRDIAGVLDVVSGRRPGDAYAAPPPLRPFLAEVGADPGRLRIGVLTHEPSGTVEIDPENVTAARKVADLLTNLGHHVSAAYPDALRKGPWPEEFMPVVAVSIMKELEFYSAAIGRELTEADVEASTWEVARMGQQVTASMYSDGVDALRQRATEIETWWEDDGWDLLLTPTTPVPPPELGLLKATVDDPLTMDLDVLTLLTVPYNITGQPAISLPVHVNADGLPIGAHLVAAYGREDVLLRVSAQIEAGLPWADKHPPVRPR
ncbi:amidase [Virgisporangium aurantiacum]|uniref:6-aminohexanoate-cyclic-dimer hydrolase n=1 Tax=Virgisporangium aurantiacum TaxID=175570 RepID=A0A8J3ZHU7_9ACTN|nr:amidase [Virgisporangium aurantiacum]GIJ63202.1 6-aminohexanoate-cyclic-dimer hydrolase [Virgisporangium aurantiacum]